MTEEEVDGSGREAGPPGVSLRASGKDGAQIIQSKGKRWTDEAEEIFLDALAASSNFTLSAKKAGFSREAIYARKRRDPAFSERCRAALGQARFRIELALLRRAEAALEGFAPDPDSPIPVMTVADAIAVLKLHQSEALGGEGSRAGWPARPRSLEEVGESILRKIAAIEAMPDDDDEV